MWRIQKIMSIEQTPKRSALFPKEFYCKFQLLSTQIIFLTIILPFYCEIKTFRIDILIDFALIIFIPLIINQ